MFLKDIIMIYCVTRALNGIFTASGDNGLVSQADRVRVRDLIFVLALGAYPLGG